MNQENALISSKTSKGFSNGLFNAVQQANDIAYRSVNFHLIRKNWLLGKRIAEEEMRSSRADNSFEEIVSVLSEKLKAEFGKGFEKADLYRFVQFYKAYPNILQTLSAQSFLSWSHYLVLLRVYSKEARDWYEKEAIAGSWSVRTLQRNVGSDYYYRMLLSKRKDLVKEEMLKITKPLQEKKLEFIRNPTALEFLGIPENNFFMETGLEKIIIDDIQALLMSSGKGYAFIGRQVRIHTEKEDYFIDLVFFNYLLNCFVLIDLKTKKITHQDVGQMDMYVRMYDEKMKEPHHNPTLGIVLCDETDEDIARYSVLKGNEQLFASKYKLCLPSEEQLKAEIDAQKVIYRLQHKKN